MSDRFTEISDALTEEFGTSDWADSINSTPKMQKALYIIFGVSDEELIPGLPIEPGGSPSDVIVPAKGDEPAKTGEDIMKDIQAPYEYLARLIVSFVNNEIDKHVDRTHGD